MNRVLEKSTLINLRYTEEKDLDFVLKAECHPDNCAYVFQWTREQHLEAMSDSDILHLIVEDNIDSKPVGYIISTGFESPERNIELKRIVITDKGKGFGREALRLIKRLSFEKFNAHRLWLDVRDHNLLAQSLYKSEGFIQEGLLRECVLYKDKFESIIIMSILENEYFNLLC
ncbi:GNAT family N-acetyltransferase [Wukongibacter sp. M2B1]|uniref:GNAT family N-acetyltransferase n=1 Tax=Wukongibacter sp. M2B1 TaxID=3088895 RepID=UPI003D790748